MSSTSSSLSEIKDQERSTLRYSSPQTLARDMSKIVNRKLFSDVHFIVGHEREKIYGHKCVLSARCEIFHQLFQTEPNKVSYDLCSVKPLPFVLLLYFLYTNSIAFDRLNIYEVYDVMRVADEYKCPELALLAESQIGILLEADTVFEFLPISFRLHKSQLKSAAVDYIEENSATLLIPGNEDLLSLTPDALAAVLKSDLLELDEMRIVEAACYWADNFLRKARETCANVERGNARASIIRIRQSVDESSHESADYPTFQGKDSDEPFGNSPIMQVALEGVASVMANLRLPLIPPNELAELEEQQQTAKLIPQECFIKAWRVMTLQSAHLPIDDDEEIKLSITPRKGTVSRTTRRKSFASDAFMNARRKAFS
ncbi:unnamed protein product [Calicophoron daubneyi]|uniref:BTB domain-containing protein n=1 Tax=Calicophoron daubneyi TaxID=300641 RepID=A0AAV2TVP1_CALDB